MSRRSGRVSRSGPVTVGDYFKVCSFRIAISCAPFESVSHKTRQSIDSRASVAANERLCPGTPILKPGLSSKASAWLKRRRTPTPHSSPTVACVPPVVAVVGQRVCVTAPVVGGLAQGDSLVPYGRHNGDTIRRSVARELRGTAKCVADGSTKGALQRRIRIRPCRFLA